MNGIEYGDARVEPNFWQLVTPESETGCWLWNGHRNPSGYGQVTRHIDGVRNKFPTHRYSYTKLVGPIPQGLVIDHLCRNPPCCNPAHLEPVTNQENVRRGYAVLRTHCPSGHLYDEANVYLDPRGRRKCRTCIREKAHARRALLTDAEASAQNRMWKQNGARRARGEAA